MKYEEELKQMFIEHFNTEIEDDEDWEDFKEHLKEITGITIEELSEKIEIGINNGATIENQIELIKIIFKTN